ncbi:YeeE/YedE family protein [Paradevosia shaoguanensis]|uniref:YeeE/YedE family protein n=1 Tax=Paradevosia shaoguanensis TaxID=1335043 RepID=A0AA41UA89_9HYPH|nr:YeeE/YedE family protein [Paradevosia shaoguanensis]MCF1741662.1 YeeE/YedE family protein [Paradevosia shaoguanensis]MCI0126145.1 YeeE/YedE family protein [Paradevosia shaoguanensis]
MTDATAGSIPRKPLIQLDRGPVAVTSAALVAGTLVIAQLVDIRQAVLFLVGALMGLTLYHASFGFTGGWRRLVVEKRGNAMRAQMLMIGVAALVFIPLLTLGNPFGQPLAGATAPVGVSVLVGAAIFGLGMQLGGGCGSGTLFTVGGGSSRMLVTLLFFIVGAVLGTAHLPWWLTQPSLPAISLGANLGVPLALLVTFVGLAAVAWVTVLVEKRAHGSLEKPKAPSTTGLPRLLHGPWPLVGAGLLLALLNIATLLIAGHPWSITYGFGLWGAKVAQAIGVPVASWEFWTWPAQAKALQASVLEDVTSVMDFGIILGAALAAGLAGKFAPRVAVPFLSLLAAAIGGLLMGYGARLSFGCNIGALFSGIASGSVHGWLWFAAAFVGSLLGIYLRPVFGMDGFKSK